MLHIYWCLDMETVLGILVSTYVDCAGHTGAYICILLLHLLVFNYVITEQTRKLNILIVIF